MTTVKINPGICGFVTKVVAESEDKEEVKINVATGCEAVKNMMKSLGDTFDAYELCLVKPGKGDLYDYASENFPVHAGCPIISGIIKCAEVECGLALQRNVEFTYE